MAYKNEDERRCVEAAAKVAGRTVSKVFVEHDSVCLEFTDGSAVYFTPTNTEGIWVVFHPSEAEQA